MRSEEQSKERKAARTQSEEPALVENLTVSIPLRRSRLASKGLEQLGRVVRPSASAAATPREVRDPNETPAAATKASPPSHPSRAQGPSRRHPEDAEKNTEMASSNNSQK
jgi:hypothetical protein